MDRRYLNSLRELRERWRAVGGPCDSRGRYSADFEALVILDEWERTHPPPAADEPVSQPSVPPAAGEPGSSKAADGTVLLEGHEGMMALDIGRLQGDLEAFIQDCTVRALVRMLVLDIEPFTNTGHPQQWFWTREVVREVPGLEARLNQMGDDAVVKPTSDRGRVQVQKKTYWGYWVAKRFLGRVGCCAIHSLALRLTGN